MNDLEGFTNKFTIFILKSSTRFYVGSYFIKFVLQNANLVPVMQGMNGAEAAKVENQKITQETLVITHATDSNSFDFNLKKKQGCSHILKVGLPYLIHITRVERKKRMCLSLKRK